MADSLLQEIIKRAQEDANARTQPMKAGDVPPATMRAAAKLQGVYPEDMAGVDIRQMRPGYNKSYSSILAEVDSNANLAVPPAGRMQEPKLKTIWMNPVVEHTLKQDRIEELLSHELQHVRQNRDKEPKENLKDFFLKYNQRPAEQEANTAMNKFREKMGKPPMADWPNLTPLEAVLITNQGKIF